MGQNDYVAVVGEHAHEIIGFTAEGIPVAYADGLPVRADSLGPWRLERRRDFAERVAQEAAAQSAAAQAEAEAARTAQASAKAAQRAAAEQQALAVAEQRQGALAAAKASRPTLRASSWSPSF